MSQPIYLDYQATTPLDPRALEAMEPYLRDCFGNPHSAQHRFGQVASDAVEHARTQVAALIGAQAREVVFTSGATEANNLAIKGAARFVGNQRRQVVTVATEHKCVLESVKALEAEGFSTTILPVDASGLIDIDQLKNALTPDTCLVSVMGVNNEIGTIQPLAEIGRLCRANGTLFHTDCAQAAGKVRLDVEAMSIDLMSLSSHKMYGPKGVGALYVRRKPRVRLEPLFSGGGQERGIRSGTVPAFLAVGFGVACAIAAVEMEEEARRIKQLSSTLRDHLLTVPGAFINGTEDERWPGNLNVCFPDIDAEALLSALEAKVAASTGSACTSASVEPSYVLSAIGLSTAMARSSIRFGIGRQTTSAEIAAAGSAILDAINDLSHESAA